MDELRLINLSHNRIELQKTKKLRKTIVKHAGLPGDFWAVSRFVAIVNLRRIVVIKLHFCTISHKVRFLFPKLLIKKFSRFLNKALKKTKFEI